LIKRRASTCPALALGLTSLYRRTALFAFLLTAHIVVAQSATLTVTVLDENAVAIPTVRVALQPHNGPPLRCETGFAGRCQFSNLTPGPAELHAEKEGFYVVGE
jgi:hypothetical protein